jgi:hypothetical protein
MEISGSGVSEDRIAALEKRLREMDALVKGLIDELLDFKAIAMTMSRQAGEDNAQEVSVGSMVWGTVSPSVAAPAESSSVIRLSGAHQPNVPVTPAEPAMVRIMQADGTMKMEPRYGERSPIDSSTGYGRTRKGAAGRSTQNPLIYAAEKDKSDRAKV